MSRASASIVLGLLLNISAARAQPGAVTIDEVLKAWTDRQAEARSGRFRLTEEVTTPAGAAKTGKDGGGRSPQNNTKCSAEHEIAFEGNRFRHAISGTQWSTNAGDCVPCNDIRTFDGELSRIFRPTSPGADRPQGNLQPGPSLMDARSLLLTPIFATLRANESYLVAFNPEDLSVSGRTLEINGRRCVELTSVHPRGGRPKALHIWVDPAMKFVPVRLTRMEGSRVLFELTVTFEPHPTMGGLPKSWTSSLYRQPNVLTEWRVVRATSIEMNVKLSDEEFAFEFPRGTMLYDDRTKDFGIVKEGNRRRTLTNAELDRPYSEQLELSGPTTPIDGSGNRWWLWLGGVGIAIVFAFVIGRRSWRNRAAA